MNLSGTREYDNVLILPPLCIVIPIHLIVNMWWFGRREALAASVFRDCGAIVDVGSDGCVVWNCGDHDVLWTTGPGTVESGRLKSRYNNI
jgi:hypothetical protein